MAGLLLVVMVMIALLYHVTPNVRRRRIRWLSIGALVAMLVWIIASAGFGFYVSNFGSYNKTYGTLAGIIVMLLWLWLTNIALLLGAQVDAEVVRIRQLRAGLPAEVQLVNDLKDDSGAEKARQKQLDAERTARRIRLAATLGPTRPDGTPLPRAAWNSTPTGSSPTLATTDDHGGSGLARFVAPEQVTQHREPFPQRRLVAVVGWPVVRRGRQQVGQVLLFGNPVRVVVSVAVPDTVTVA